MYKKQLVFQKIVCFAVLAASALVFLYSLGIVTDLYDSLYYTMRNPDDFYDTKVAGSIIYYDIQGFNKNLVKAALLSVLASCFLFITNTHIRRRYYVSNYVIIGIQTALSAAMGIWAVMNIAAYKTQFLTTVDFEALKEQSERFPAFIKYTESTFCFDIGFVVMGLSMLFAALMLINLIWKIRLMKAEKNLLAQGSDREGGLA